MSGAWQREDSCHPRVPGRHALRRAPGEAGPCSTVGGAGGRGGTVCREASPAGRPQGARPVLLAASGLGHALASRTCLFKGLVLTFSQGSEEMQKVLVTR